MRGGRSLLLLVVLALGLGAYIYFVELKREPAGTTAPHDKVFTVESGGIEEIEIRSATGQTTTLKKSGTTWQIVAPVTTSADASVVDALVSSLETLEIQRVLQEAPASMTPFGLEPPRFSIAFRSTGVTAQQRVNFGTKTPTGSDIYARVEGQPRLLLISGYVEDTFNRETFALRDKDALKFESAAVDTLTIETAGSPTLSLVKKDSDWRLTAPITARADFGQVDDVIRAVDQAAMQAIVAGDAGNPTAAELRTFGLDRPRAVVTVGTGSSRASLAIGGAKEKDPTTVYARDLSRPLVFTVPSSLFDGFKKKPDDIRQKDVFAFRAYSAQGLTVTSGGKTLSVAKETAAATATTPATDVWKKVAPETGEVNQTAMTDFLNSLSSLRMEKFVPSAPASGEDVVVVARSGTAPAASEEHVTLRKAGGTAYAIRKDEPGAATVPTADLDKILSQFKELSGGK